MCNRGLILCGLLSAIACVPACGGRSETVHAKPALPKEVSLSLGNDMTIDFVLIAPGTFLMGSAATEEGRSTNEGPQHEVKISKPFYMSKYEVTQAQYEQVMGNNPSAFKGAENPVDSVSWNDAVRFCEKVSQIASASVRLPTEAQWEYVCRAGSRRRISFGDSDDSLYKYCNYDDIQNDAIDLVIVRVKKQDDGFEHTAPVGSYRPNAYGLYDMEGNVSEWSADWWSDSYDDITIQDPVGPKSGDKRVVRGGSFASSPSTCRCACRFGWVPSNEWPAIPTAFIGFRVSVQLK